MVGLRALAPLHVDAVLAFCRDLRQPGCRHAGHLSDHMDWPGLNELVAGSGAETVSFVHGFSAAAARWFDECGLATESF